MSRDVLELVEKADMEDVKTQLVLQCAPFLMGLKLSNLLMISGEQLEQTELVLQECGISYQVLLVTAEKAAVLLYEKEKLLAYLADGKVRRNLHLMGYENMALEDVFSRFGVRYRIYMENQKEFPHEMGYLLGYPPEDVEGFIHNKGEGFLYAGYWKVYDNLPAKIQLFYRFENATKELMRCILKGMDITDIVSGNIKNKLQSAAV